MGIAPLSLKWILDRSPRDVAGQDEENALRFDSPAGDLEGGERGGGGGGVTGRSRKGGRSGRER
jgi:hypothetical protein